MHAKVCTLTLATPYLTPVATMSECMAVNAYMHFPRTSAARGGSRGLECMVTVFSMSEGMKVGMHMYFPRTSTARGFSRGLEWMLNAIPTR